MNIINISCAAQTLSLTQSLLFKNLTEKNKTQLRLSNVYGNNPEFEDMRI